MTWYINIGDDLIRDKTLKFSFFRTLDEKFSTQDLIFKDSLFESDDEYVSFSVFLLCICRCH